eukprot:2506586-Prymnesium_polylepis.1
MAGEGSGWQVRGRDGRRGARTAGRHGLRCRFYLHRRLAARRYKAELDEVRRHLGPVGGGHVRHVLDEARLDVGLDPLHEAPVQDAEPPVGRAQQIARVRVAVQRAAIKHHPEVSRHRQRAEPRHVGGGGTRAVQPLALDPLGREHAPAAQRVEHARREHAPLECAARQPVVERRR